MKMQGIEGAVAVRTGWQQLALYYLNGHNPKIERAITIMDAIVVYSATQNIDNLTRLDQPLRYTAHEFVRKAVLHIERGQELNPLHTLDKWVMDWTKDNF